MKEIKEIENDTEDEKDLIIDLDEEKLMALLDEIEKQEFMTEEEADAWFAEKEQELIKRQIKWNHKGQKDEPQDEYDKFFDAKPRIESELDNAVVLDQEGFNALLKLRARDIGRYPHAFRHYENYVNYRAVYPQSTIQEYIEEMNRPCTMEEFISITRQWMLGLVDDPAVRFDLKMDDDE